MNSEPELLKRVPAIAGFIRNLISTSPMIQLPAIMHGIVSAFRRDGVSESDVDDRDFARYISNIIGSKDSRLDIDYSALGLGVGTKDDFDTNDGDDVWQNLTPNKR